jgi:hypothetical protein
VDGKADEPKQSEMEIQKGGNRLKPEFHGNENGGRDLCKSFNFARLMASTTGR